MVFFLGAVTGGKERIDGVGSIRTSFLGLLGSSLDAANKEKFCIVSYFLGDSGLWTIDPIGGKGGGKRLSLDLIANDNSSKRIEDFYGFDDFGFTQSG
jgi:hypothetical protein